jgi:putative SOS response-associated peptidase YedK
MCNLYSITTNQEAICGLFRVVNRYVGNLPPMPGVFPDDPAPVIRNAGDEREMILMRWGTFRCRTSERLSGPYCAVVERLGARHSTHVAQNSLSLSRPIVVSLPDTKRHPTW